jgi:hypothetical protein
MGGQWTLRSRMRKHELNLSGLGRGQVAGCCEHENEPFAFIQCREFFDWLRVSKLPKKFSAAFSLLTFSCLASGFTACIEAWTLGVSFQQGQRFCCSPWFETRWGRYCLHSSQPVLKSTWSPVQWVLGLFTRDKAAWVWHWLPTAV